MTFKNNELFINRAKKNLNRDNDLFGITDKGDAIIKVLQGADELRGNNMLALYGGWGTGKTSLMDYIIKNINLNIEDNKAFKPIFFEAWKYEGDQNLALSLLELVIEELDRDIKFKESKELIEEAGMTILTFGKNILFNSKIDILGTGIGFNLGQAAKDTEKERSDKNQKKSLYYQHEEFKNKLKDLEKLVKQKYSYLVIFIDDLDRCEPENVLDLLASIKLFFTHNENFIYFCGVDKEAVKNSIDVKYRSIIKSNEYLEKIFDITFTMPESLDLNKIINLYFKESIVKNKDGLEYKYKNIINYFFKFIGFNNPRHIKKVFNKFELLRRFKHISSDDNFPTIDNDENVLLIIVTLYLIILHEFSKEVFDDLLSYEKFYSIYEFNDKKTEVFQITNKNQAKIKDIVDELYNEEICISLEAIKKISSHKCPYNLFGLIITFLPHIEKNFNINPHVAFNDIDNIGNVGFDNLDEFINQFSNKDNVLQIGFLRFLLYINRHIKEYGLNEEESTSIKSLIYYIKLYL